MHLESNPIPTRDSQKAQTQSRGIDSPVASRRRDGAQMKWCRDPRCSPSGNPACRGTLGGRTKGVRCRFALQGGAPAGQVPECLTPGLSSHLCPFYLGPAPRLMGLTLSVVCLKPSWSHTGPRAPPTPASPRWRPWPHLARPRAPFSPSSCLPNPLPQGLIRLLLPHLLLWNRILVPALLLMGLGHREGRKRRQRLEPSRPQGGIPLVLATQKTASDWGQHPWAGE